MGIYTDLACEARQMDPAIDGITDEREEMGEISVVRTFVKTDEAALKIGKRKGSYVTIEAPDLILRPLDLFKKTALVLSKELKKLSRVDLSDSEILMVGLGNREVTPDSLGSLTASEVFVTRHVLKYYPEVFDFKAASVSVIVPGVLGTTGIETADLITGTIAETKPDIIIAVDSLASRRAARINTSIQITDAGIDPGSGVGNIRAGLNSETLNTPVIAIGVPLVVRASTIYHDIRSSVSKGEESDQNEIDDKLEGLIVTPKDIDTIVKDMSGILAEGINRAIFGMNYSKVMELVK